MWPLLRKSSRTFRKLENMTFFLAENNDHTYFSCFKNLVKEFSLGDFVVCFFIFVKTKSPLVSRIYFFGQRKDFTILSLFSPSTSFAVRGLYAKRREREKKNAVKRKKAEKHTKQVSSLPHQTPPSLTRPHPSNLAKVLSGKRGKGFFLRKCIPSVWGVGWGTLH